MSEYTELVKQNQHEADNGDREAAKTAVCPECGKVGLRYVISKDGDTGYRCDNCRTTDWI